MQDPISDLLTRIRNAQMAGHESVDVPNSKIKRGILQVLLDEGFINGFEIDDAAKSTLHIDLRYHNGSGVIEEIKRISRPGLCIYKECADLPQVRGGLGIAVVITTAKAASPK